VYDRVKELEELKKMFKKNLCKVEELRTNQKIISILAKHFVKTSGYSIASTVLKREFRKIGKQHAEKIVKVFGINGKDVVSAKRALKIAAMELGLRLKVVDDVTVAKECPYSVEVMNNGGELVCQICREYCTGIVEGILGDGYEITQREKIASGQRYCKFEIVKI